MLADAIRLLVFPALMAFAASSDLFGFRYTVVFPLRWGEGTMNSLYYRSQDEGLAAVIFGVLGLWGVHSTLLMIRRPFPPLGDVSLA